MAAGRPMIGQPPDGLPAGLAQVADATDRLIADVESLDDAALREPSTLPGWSRAHVVTHLSRHADALCRTADAARRGDLVEPYVGGPAGRSAEIEEGAQRDAMSIRRDLAASVERLAAVWRHLPPETWTQPTKALRGTRPLAAGVTARLVEVEVHHVDLGVGRRPSDWSPAFVGAGLDYGVAGLPTRPAARKAGSSARWFLWCTDLRRGWYVDRGVSTTVVNPVSRTDGTLPTDHQVTGVGHDILAWLLGRCPQGRGLTVRGTGERSEALALPSMFPFP